MSDEQYIECRNYSSCGDFTDGENDYCDNCLDEQREKKQAATRFLQGAYCLQGYGLGKSGLTIIEVINAIGISRNEWEAMLQQDLIYLDESDQEQLNTYFNMPESE